MLNRNKMPIKRNANTNLGLFLKNLTLDWILQPTIINKTNIIKKTTLTNVLVPIYSQLITTPMNIDLEIDPYIHCLISCLR